MENEFNFTAHQVLDFEQSALWRFILSELGEWEKSILNELAMPSFNSESGKMEFNQDQRALYDEGLRGSLKAIGFFKNLPPMLAETLNQKENSDE